MNALRALPCLLLALCACSRSPEEPRVLPPRPAIWSEYLSPAQVKESLPRLAQIGVDLNLAAAKGGWTDPELVDVVREADRVGVRVRLWPLVTVDEGYWACESNSAVVRDHVRDLIALIERERLPVDTFEIDVEMHRRRLEALQKLQAEGASLFDLLDFLKAGRDPVAFEAGREGYRALVRELHERGYRANLTTIPQVLDDLEDGDDTIQDLLDVPVTGIDWDRLSFQLYRTTFEHDFGALIEGQTLTADIVFDYAYTARRHFRERAAVDLGLIASEGSGFLGYSTPQPLREDLAAARAAGIPAIQMQAFALDGLRERSDWEAWIGGIEQIAPARPPASETTQAMRGYFRALDAL